jgi:hypothetical protein
MSFPSVPSATSEAAADSVNPTAAANLREQIHALIQKSPDGLTDEEIQDQLKLEGNTERPRRWELSKAGRIGKSGTRATKTGRQAAVWIINYIPIDRPITIKKAVPLVPKTVSVNHCSPTGRLLETLTAVRKQDSNTTTLSNISKSLDIQPGDTLEIIGA